MGTGYYIYCNNCIDIEKIDYEENQNKYRGRLFSVSSGGSMMCFTKEQLWDNDKNKIGVLPIDEKEIFNKIVAKKGNGWDFVNPVGWLPYYCENCKSLEDKFYLKMIKGNEIYLPQYVCRNCKTGLKSVVLNSETKNSGSWADDLVKNEVGELVLFENNGIVTIKDRINKKYGLECKKCRGNTFIIRVACYFD